jgi:hypothetical protein
MSFILAFHISPHNPITYQGKNPDGQSNHQGDKPMALTEATLQDKIEIVGDYKHVQVRTATVISRDGVEISRSFSRHVVSPLDDISGQSAEVQAICAVVHTDEVKAAYTELLAQQSLGK